MARVIHEVSPAFNVLAQLRIDKKAAENAAIEARRQVDKQIIDLPEFVAIKKEKGATSLNSDMYKIEVTYGQDEEYDAQKIAMELPVDIFKRIFPPKHEFSKSAYNVVIKELEGQALTDAKARKTLDRVKKCLSEHCNKKAASTQIAITPFAD